LKLLFDTHIWLWSLADPDRLSSRVRKELGTPANELWLSPVSIWEILYLDAKKKIKLPAPAAEWLADAMSAVPAKEAPFTHDVALETSRIFLPHRDPADRFLVATANVFGLTLVTADKVLIEAKACAILASR
jgi:PIN domain nuclease of toxin-antitoxin system